MVLFCNSGITLSSTFRRQVAFGLSGIATLLFLAALPCSAQKPAPQKPTTPKTPVRRPVYLRRDRTTLLLGKAPFRNIGLNLPTLFHDCLANQTQAVEAVLVRAKAAGVRCVRCSRIFADAESVRLLETDPERWHAAFARMLTLADAQGIHVVPTLCSRYDTLIPLLESPAPSGSIANSVSQQGGTTNSRITALIRAIVTRHKDEPRILFWEIADGWNRDAEQTGKPTTEQMTQFLAQMAAVIKQSDKKHLISSGNAEIPPDAFHKRDKKTGLDSFSDYAAMLSALTPAPVDFATVQQYPLGEQSPFWLVANDNAALVFPWTRNAADRINRPLFVAEFGSVAPLAGSLPSRLWMTDFLKRMEAGVAPLACIAPTDFEDADTVRLLAEANAAILVEVTAEAQSRR